MGITFNGPRISLLNLTITRILTKELIRSFSIGRTSRSLAFRVDGDMRKVQVRVRSLDLTEAIVKVVGEGCD